MARVLRNIEDYMIRSENRFNMNIEEDPNKEQTSDKKKKCVFYK